MSDAMFLIFVMWVLYGIALWTKPETFVPLLWVVGVATIFYALLGMFVESARSAQEKIMKELIHKQHMEQEAFNHQAELNYRSQVNAFNKDNASYFIDGLGRTQNKPK